MKAEMGESFEEIKELKLKEIRALMCIGWEIEIDTCKSLEGPLNELVNIYKYFEKEMPENERIFIKNTI
jgi:hypothetical protein